MIKISITRISPQKWTIQDVCCQEAENVLDMWVEYKGYLEREGEYPHITLRHIPAGMQVIVERDYLKTCEIIALLNGEKPNNPILPEYALKMAAYWVELHQRRHANGDVPSVLEEIQGYWDMSLDVAQQIVKKEGSI